MISAVGKLGPGERLSDLIGPEAVYVYRWVPDYAGTEIRPGDYVLLDPEYRQGNEYKFVGERPKRAYDSGRQP